MVRLAYGLAGWNTGWVGKLGSFWPDEPDHLDAFQQGISAGCGSVPRWVPGAMFQFITQSLTWVRCLQWTNASQAHPCLIYVNAGLGEINEGRQCYSTIVFSFGGSSLLYSPTFFCHCHFIVCFGGACFPNLCPIPENGTAFTSVRMVSELNLTHGNRFLFFFIQETFLLSLQSYT